MATLTRIDPVAYTQKQNTKLKACAYCRVSSNSADQLNSYATQIRHYTKKIRENPEWEMIDIFADEGITGTRSDKRNEFQRMIKLCEHGKIDLIITKSVSRFARNVPECLEYARKLKRKGIGIFFEKESINTLRMNDELMLSVFSAIAQEESIAISQRLRHANLERMKRGEYVAGTCPFGYRLENKQLVIYEPEAEIVRNLYTAYLSGASINELARDLTNEHVNKRHSTQWHYISIYYILTNEKYTGDTLLQKTYKTDVLPFEKKKNNGEKDQYYVTGSHEPIIDKDTFETVQKLLKERSQHFGKPKAQTNYPLSKSIRCKNCGAYLVRRTNKGKTIWTCYNHMRSKDNCDSKCYREEDIYRAYMLMFNKLFKHRNVLLKQALLHMEYVMNYKKKHNPQLKVFNLGLAELLDKKVMLEELRAKGYLSEELYYTQCKDIDRQMKEIKSDKALLNDSEMEEQYSNVRMLYEILDDYGMEMYSYDAEIIDKIVKHAEITSDGTVEFHLIGGLKLSERL